MHAAVGYLPGFLFPVVKKNLHEFQSSDHNPTGVMARLSPGDITFQATGHQAALFFFFLLPLSLSLSRLYPPLWVVGIHWGKTPLWLGPIPPARASPER